MGPLRRRLITPLFCMAGGPAWADVCETLRPAWDGTPVTMWGELVTLLQTPFVLFLIISTALALRLRSEWGGLAVVVGWSLASFLALGFWVDGHDAARLVGCIGSPTLFIAVAGLTGIGVVLYTAPLKARDKE